MVPIWIFAVITIVVGVSSLGCGQQQGAGDTTSGSTEQPPTSPEETRTPAATTTEETTSLSVECPTNEYMVRGSDYARGTKGEKGSPVELARRAYSKKIREGDTVEIAEHTTGRPPTTTVRVIREGRVLALIEYRRWRGGWLEDIYTACFTF